MAIRRNKKKTDETLVDLVEARDQASDFMDKNQSKLLMGLVALVLIVGGFLAYKHMIKAPKEVEAAGAMAKAQDLFARDSFAMALQSNGDYLGFLDIIDSYGSTHAGNTANYYAGVSYLHLGEYDAALSFLKDYSGHGEVLPIMKNGAMGDAYGELSQFDQAISSYQKAVKAGENDFLESYYLKKIGLLHEKQGNFASSIEAFKQIKKDYPTSTDGRDIDKYISRAQAKL